MYQEKYLLFTSGGGSTDPLNWSRDEAALYPVSKFLGIRPGSYSTLDLFFDSGSGTQEKVILKIKNGTHIKVMAAIANAIEVNKNGVISVIDMDSDRRLDPAIYGVTLTS